MKAETLLLVGGVGAGVLLLLYYGNRTDRNAGGAQPANGLGPMGIAARETANVAAVLAADTATGIIDGLARGAGQGLGQILTRFDPTDSNNAPATFVNGLVQQATGDQNTSLGGKLWDWAHPGWDPSAGKTCTNFLGIGCP